MTILQRAASALPRLFAAVVTAASMLGGAAHADPRVGVSVNIGQPGFYGRINIGDQPPPAVIYHQPIIVEQTPVAVHRRPIYLRVPPAHSSSWSRYCGRYSACGQPVYFVRYSDRMEHRDRHFDRHHHHHHDRHDRRHDDRGHRHGKDRDHRGHGHHGHDHRR